MESLYNATIHEIAESYMKCEYGESYNPIFTDISLQQAARIADSFDNGIQYTPESLRAYDEFISELLAQWEYVIQSGLHIEPWTQAGEPYKNSRELFNDVKDNNHMWFFLTSNGFGSASESKHPLLKPSGYNVIDSNNERVYLVYNDIFRIVHDYFGHCIYGFQFGLKGETNAWQSHLTMFRTHGSRRALTNETQGQTSWFQAGRHLRRADGSLPVKGESDYIPLNERPFAEQRVQLLPNRKFEGLARI